MGAADLTNLRSLADKQDPIVRYALHGAADEIERLRAEVAEIRRVWVDPDPGI